jgi:hypothetical protein
MSMSKAKSQAVDPLIAFVETAEAVLAQTRKVSELWFHGASLDAIVRERQGYAACKDDLKCWMRGAGVRLHQLDTGSRLDALKRIQTIIEACYRVMDYDESLVRGIHLMVSRNATVEEIAFQRDRQWQGQYATEWSSHNTKLIKLLGKLRLLLSPAWVKPLSQLDVRII